MCDSRSGSVFCTTSIPCVLPHSLSLQILLPLLYNVHKWKCTHFLRRVCSNICLHPVSPAAYCSRIGLTFRLPGESSHNLYLTGVLLYRLYHGTANLICLIRDQITQFLSFLLGSTSPIFRPFLPARLPVTSPDHTVQLENRPVFSSGQSQKLSFSDDIPAICAGPSVRLPTP